MNDDVVVAVAVVVSLLIDASMLINDELDDFLDEVARLSSRERSFFSF